MAQSKNVERKISKVEKFNVAIKNQNGRTTNDKQELGRTYEKTNAADGNWSVNKWKKSRFEANISSGYQVDVLDGDGKPAHGNKKLKTVRASYFSKKGKE